MPVDPGEADAVASALVELDKQETFIRQLARRVDRGDDAHPWMELDVSRRMYRAFEYAHLHADSIRENPRRPDPALVVLARANCQAIVIERLAERIEALGGDIEASAIRKQLREVMSHRPERQVLDVPEAARASIARDFCELVSKRRQELLLHLDAALWRAESTDGE